MGEKCQPIYFFVCDIKNKTDKLFNLMKKKKKREDLTRQRSENLYLFPML